MLIPVMLSVQILVLLLISLWGRHRYGDFIRAHPNPYQLKLLSAYGYALVDCSSLMEKLPEATAKIHHKLIKLHGRNFAAYGTKWFFAELISVSTICLIMFTIFAMLAGGENAFLGFGVFLAIILPILLVRDLDVKIRKKQQWMIMELPEVLTTIVLLVNAGETVHGAWMRGVEARPHKAQTPLYTEMLRTVHELEMNISFSKTMEDFSKRCAVHEVSLFTSALLLNYKRGGNDFVTSLHSLSLELWQRRKSVARTLGEEASSKLVFPMVLIFVVVMIIVATPALLMMQQ